MITSTILKNLIAFLAPVVAIFLVLFCVFQGGKLIKGSENGSVKKLIGGIVLFFFILGVMYAAGSFDTYATMFSNFAGSAVNQIGENATTIIGGAE